MAGIFAYIDSDIKKIERLKSEIEAVKKALASINIKVDIDIAKGLEERLQKLTGQYDALISKIAASDAKIKEAESRMNSAAKRIMEAQQRMSRSATGQGVNSSQPEGSTASANAQTENIKAQAKAYEELRGVINDASGTFTEHIRRWNEATNAIRLYNKELNAIKKAQSQRGTDYTEAETRRIGVLNAAIEANRQKRNEASRDMRTQIKIYQAAEGSLNQLRAQLVQMKNAYADMSDLGTKEAKEMLAAIQQTNTKVSEIEQSMGVYSRNVGNYSSAFNGLGMSVQQIVRELPAATIGLNTFFLAISNNLPILTDEIKRARDMNEQLKASGQSTVPVWKQLVSSIFSWQTAMMVAITVMSMYGKEIMNWIGNLFKTKDATDEIRKSQEKFNTYVRKLNEDWRNSVATTAGENIAAYQRLAREYNTLGDNMKAKKKFITDNQDAFHGLGFSINGVTDAENLFVKNTGAVVDALVARAKAAAYEQEITDATLRYIKQTEYNKSTVAGGGYYYRIRAGKNWTTTGLVPEELRGLKEGEDYTVESSQTVASYTLMAAGAAKINAQRSRDAADRLKKNNDEAKRQLDSVVSRATEGIKQQVASEKAIYDSLDLKKYDASDANKDKDGKKTTEKRMKAQSDADKALLALQQKNQDDEISLMRDGTEKKLEEIKNDYKKRIAEIDKQEADFKEKNKEAGLTELDADGLTAEQYKELAKARENAKKDAERQTEEIYRNEAQSMRDYLKEYGTYQQQKLAIAEEYAEKIRNAQSEGERLSLEKEREQAVANVNLSAIRQDVDWAGVFSEFGTMFQDEIERNLDALRDVMKSDEFKAMQPTDQAQIVEAVDSLRAQVTGDLKDVDFKKIGELTVEFQNAQRKMITAQTAEAAAYDNLKKAQADYEQALRNGTTEEQAAAKERLDMAKTTADSMSAAYKGAVGEFNATGNNLKDATDNAVDAINSISSAISQIRSGSLSGAFEGVKNLSGTLGKSLSNMSGLLGKVGNALSTFSSTLGGATGQIVGAVLGLLDLLKDGLGSIFADLSDLMFSAVNSILDDIFSGGIITKPLKSLMDGLGGILDTVTFGGFSHWGNNAAETKETIDRLMTRNDALIASLDRLNDTIKDSAGAAESVAAAEKAKEYQQEINENYRDAAAAQAHYQEKHRSWSHYFNEWLDMVDYLEDLPEGAFTIFGNRDDDLKTKQKMDEIAGFEIKSRTDFLSVTPEQMAEMLADVDIRELIKNIGEGGYGAKMLAALEDYADQAGKIEEIENTLRETLTQISFDSMYDSFIDKLMDMDADAQDFADDFAEYMMRAMLADEVGSLYKDRLQDWYTAFADFMKNKDGLTEDEKNRMLSDLRNEWDDIINEGLATRDELAEVTGYDNTSSSSSQQKASSKGFETMSQDMAGELNGRFTALNETGLRIEAQGEIKVQTLNELKGSVSDIASHIQGVNNIANETRNILADSYLELQAINGNTAAIVEPIRKIQKDMEQVKQNTSRI